MQPDQSGPTRPGVPRRVCGRCGEYEPHWCAPEVTITRQQWTGRRIVTVRDRSERGQAA